MASGLLPLDLLSCPLAGVRQIEASAGTGKTWSLCGLYARLVLERQMSVQQILVVTFTNAATAELRERIRTRLSDLLARLHGRSNEDLFIDDLLDAARAQGHADSVLVERLELALATFDEAAIFTIHGFCQRALADAPFTAHAPLALELAPDDAHWALQAAMDFWRRHVASDEIAPALAALLVTKKASPETFAKLLRRQLARPLAKPLWPPELDTADAADTSTLLRAHAQATSLWTQRRGAILEIVNDAMEAGVLNRTTYKRQRVEKAARAWDQLASTRDGVAALARLDNSDQRKSFELFVLFTANFLAVKTNGKKPPPVDPFFAQAQALLDARDAAERALELQRLALVKQLLVEGVRDVRAAKRTARVVGFDDMLSLLHERLAAPQGDALAQDLATRYPAALIDEFQDTDPLQWAIFSRLYARGPGPLFLIGDPKQAIYSFRNADLHTYLRAGARADARASLTQNQRSTPALIQGLNTLFQRNAKAFMLDGLEYQPVSAGAKPRRPLRDDSRGGTRPAALQVWMLPGCEGAEGGASAPLWT
ncbi:MAG TPA: UvrD-helicase domain-containing protein, partial [Burkholderiaceae bacterium]|nr:UvrD-helicase domain-containing protein [Burkholderiaceae bacterium]